MITKDVHESTHNCVLILLLIISIFSCKNKTVNQQSYNDEAQFTLLNSSKTGIEFINTSIESPERNLGHYDYFYNGSGVAIGDINNDGLSDIFFAGNDAINKLYLNTGNFEFKDISHDAGVESDRWSTGVTMIDINNDGFLDIYVCNSGPYTEDSKLANQLYINNGDLTFSERAAEYGLDDSSYSSQAVFFDMDRDGDLDVFVMNHSLINYEKQVHKWEEHLLSKSSRIRDKSYSHIYKNNGDNIFINVSKESGIYKPGFGLGVAVSDFDENGFLDLYIANDYFIPDFMFFNNGDGTFVDGIETKISHSSFFSMGCDAADFNNDGLIDLTVVDMTSSDHYRSKTLMESMDIDKFNYLTNYKKYVPQYMFNTLNLNRGKGNFSEIGFLAGVSKTDWSWASLMVDLDNDTWKDIFVTNGYKRDTKDRDWVNELNRRYAQEGVNGQVVFEQLMKSSSVPIPNYAFKNSGGLKFKDESDTWGFSDPSFSQGAAYGDLDNDGDLDMVINNLEKMAFVYRNNTSSKTNNNFIQFELSDNGSVNKAMHSRIKVFSGESVQTVEYSFVRGYLSTMQPLAHFGLSELNKVDKVEIYWPDNTLSTIRNPKINTKHHIDRNDVQTLVVNNQSAQLPFLDVSNRIGLSNVQHLENEFDDYRDEILLPHKLSTLGPCIAVGDVNGDSLDDFFVGGAKGQSGRIYVQDPKKGFIIKDMPNLNYDKDYEDIGAIFFDADGDADMDLYVASGGGGDIKDEVHLFQDRLYLNSGDGVFHKSITALPELKSSSSSISPVDWDKDGDLDLFVGGRNTPGKYPLSPNSYLLENINGQFKDVTKSIAPELSTIGMITGSCWSDINDDQREDLILVGEWMPVTVFINTVNGFEKQGSSLGLPEAVGWFYSIEKGDFDNDGDEDFIAGNLGLNNKFQPSPEKPLHIYANDFDNSGSLDIVLSKMYKGNLAPLRGKECSTEQMPFIAEKFPTFSEFASSTLEDIYGLDKLKNSVHYQATDFASLYIENRGDGSFDTFQLPAEAQLSPIMGTVICDFDKDGKMDLVIAGNLFDTEVETPSYDAGKGLYLKGNGDGTFLPYLKIEDSGIFMPQNVRDIQLIYILKEKRPAVLVANNNSNLNLFAWTK